MRAPHVAALIAVLIFGQGAPSAALTEEQKAEVVVELLTHADARIVSAALCSGPCIEGSGDMTHLTGIPATVDGDDYRFSEVPFGKYAIAVAYQLLDSEGQPTETAGAYLRTHHGGTATIVSAFTDASRPRINAARCDLGMDLIDFVEKPVAVHDPRVRLIATSGGTLGGTARLGYRATRLIPSAVVIQRVLGCGGRVIARKRITGRTGTYRYYIEIQLRKAKRMTRVQCVIKQPDRSPVRRVDTWGPIPDTGC